MISEKKISLPTLPFYVNEELTAGLPWTSCSPAAAYIHSNAVDRSYMCQGTALVQMHRPSGFLQTLAISPHFPRVTHRPRAHPCWLHTRSEYQTLL